VAGLGLAGGGVKKVFEPKMLGSGSIEPAHEIEAVCSNCGFDVDEAELAASTCSDCGQALVLKQSVAIKVTTVPMSGASM
jgi:DNA-directed RNA polymerase subunit RPC12/RpoP